MARRDKWLWAVVSLVISADVAAWGAGENAGSTDKSWRAAALRRYDRDSNGRLSDAEREVMRKEVFAERRQPSRRGRGMMFPPEIVAKYDKDGDGSLDESESRTAQQALQKMFRELQQKYDVNSNGNFEPAEVKALQADAAAGKLEDVPKFFIQMLSMSGPRMRRGGPSANSGPEIELRQMDKDGDGRLNAEELRVARMALERARAAAPASQDQPQP